MNIIQCTLCKKPFQSYGSKACPTCLEELDGNFIKVRDYLDDNPNAGIDKVSEETEVSKRVIMYLIKEGRLIIATTDGSGALICEVCKKPIETGRICNKCKDNLASVMQKNAGGSKQSEPRQQENLKGTAKIGS